MGMRQKEVSRIRIFIAVINMCSLDGCVFGGREWAWGWGGRYVLRLLYLKIQAKSGTHVHLHRSSAPCHVAVGSCSKTRPRAFFQSEIFEDDTNFLIFQIQQKKKCYLTLFKFDFSKIQNSFFDPLPF